MPFDIADYKQIIHGKVPSLMLRLFIIRYDHV